MILNMNRTKIGKFAYIRMLFPRKDIRNSRIANDPLLPTKEDKLIILDYIK